MKPAKKKNVRRELPYEMRMKVATEIVNGKMIKQVAGDWGITSAYAYQIFYEFLEWKAEWKHKLQSINIELQTTDLEEIALKDAI